MPRVDTILIGAESQRLVTRENLVTGSTPITQMQTVREVFAATSLRFFDHIGALAAVKGEPWRTFHSTYLSQVRRDRKTRRGEIRAYVGSFADTWRQQPLRTLSTDLGRSLDESHLNVMGFAENFPIHLMRQILAERGRYPSPDRAPDVRAEFARMSGRSTDRILKKLRPFSRISEEYDEIVAACRRNTGRISERDYHGRLMTIFEALPFADVEEVVWDHLSSKKWRTSSWR